MATVRPRRPLGAFLPALLVLAMVAAARAQDRPPVAGPAQDRVSRMEALLDEGDLEKAFKEIDAALAEDPGLAAAHAARVKAWLAAGDPTKALAAAQDGAANCPGNPVVQTALARALIASGNPSAARDAADGALKSPGAPAAAWRLKAEAMAALAPEDATAGDKVFAEALAARPGDADLLGEQASFLLSRGRAVDAVEPAKKAAEAAPLVPGPRILLVRVFLKAKKIPEAREAAAMAVGSFPECAELQYYAGRTYEEGGEPAAAIPFFDRASKLRPRRTEYRASLGFAMAKAGLWKDAEGVLRAAVKADPACIEAHMHLGWVLNHQGKLSDALTEYEVVLKSRPDHARTLWNAADLYQILGKQKDAARALERLLALDPNQDEAHRLLAQIDFKMGKFEDARKRLERCLAIAPKNARALLLRGQIEIDEESFEDAEKTLLAAAEADPAFSWPHLYLGEMYDQDDRPVDALKAFRKYLALGGPDPDGTVKKAVDALAKETGQ